MFYFVTVLKPIHSPSLSIVHYQLSIIFTALRQAQGPPSTSSGTGIHCKLSTVNCQLSTVNCQLLN